MPDSPSGAALDVLLELLLAGRLLELMPDAPLAVVLEAYELPEAADDSASEASCWLAALETLSRLTALSTADEYEEPLSPASAASAACAAKGQSSSAAVRQTANMGLNSLILLLFRMVTTPSFLIEDYFCFHPIQGTVARCEHIPHPGVFLLGF